MTIFSFLHRVGIYHIKEYQDPVKPATDVVRNIHSRKDRCLGCNPNLLPNQVLS